jgi:hypothetical protein
MTTAATAALSPEPFDGPGLGATADDTQTITWADFKAWERQLATTGSCSHPFQLTGRIEAIDRTTGEVAPIYDSATEPDGALHVACGNRRETVCPACSAVYKRDARQLVRAGLVGARACPSRWPLTPACSPPSPRCPHGRDVSCPIRHVEDDPRLGRPMCPDCYDYEAAVLFNLHAADLWRRFTTYLPRHLARLTGITGTQLRQGMARPPYRGRRRPGRSPAERVRAHPV